MTDTGSSQRQGATGAAAPTPPTDDEHHVHLDVVVDGSTVSGSISADGGDPQPFHGRLGLITAIDHALDHLAPGSAGGAPTDDRTQGRPRSDR